MVRYWRTISIRLWYGSRLESERLFYTFDYEKSYFEDRKEQ